MEFEEVFVLYGSQGGEFFLFGRFILVEERVEKVFGLAEGEFFLGVCVIFFERRTRISNCSRVGGSGDRLEDLLEKDARFFAETIEFEVDPGALGVDGGGEVGFCRSGEDRMEEIGEMGAVKGCEDLGAGAWIESGERRWRRMDASGFLNSPQRHNRRSRFRFER